MKLYLAGMINEKLENIREIKERYNPEILLSYGDKAPNHFETFCKFGFKNIFIDSGAFSSWTVGKELDTDEYIEWINSNSVNIGLFGQVDSIPGDRIKGHTAEQVKDAAEKTWENYLYMYERVNNPENLLYTFHVGEPYIYLKNALEWKNSRGESMKYMALGGMVGKSNIVRKNFLDKCFSIIKESSNSDIKVHGFGMTSLKLMNEFPLTSVDSTTWVMGAAMGRIMTDNGIIAVSDIQKHDMNHFSHLDNEHLSELESFINEQGFKLDELRHSRTKRMMFNIQYMLATTLNVQPAIRNKKRLF